MTCYFIPYNGLILKGKFSKNSPKNYFRKINFRNFAISSVCAAKNIFGVSVEIMAASTCSTGAVEVSTVVRGYHVYQEIWTAPLGEVLFCQQETNNHHDRFAVAIIKDGEVVGHVRREISSICSMFLLTGTIKCEVTGDRQYSYDLAQGGMHVPRKLRFACSDQEILKTKNKLLDLALKKINAERPLKRIKLEPVETPDLLKYQSTQSCTISCFRSNDCE